MCSHGPRSNFRNVALQQPALRRFINKERELARALDGVGRERLYRLSRLLARGGRICMY
jgi:hypothetical protein